MKNESMVRLRTDLVGKLMIQYAAALAIYFFAMIVCGLLFAELLQNRVWQKTDPLYPFFHWAKDNIAVLILLVMTVGWLFVTFFFAVRGYYYLAKVIGASESLVMRQGELIRLPAALKDVQDELNLVNEQNKRNREMAREAEQRKNDLIVYLAHDLKTPLTSVIGYLSLLHEQPDLPPKQRERFCGIALEKAERLEVLINEFFEITRFNLSEISLEFENICLSRMLEQIVSEFYPMMREKHLEWELNIGRDIFVRCDPDKLERVFDNLIRNAINYSYPRSKLYLSLERQQDILYILLQNRGKTIPSEKLAHIFDQFFRLDVSRATSTGGAGLGLAIAKKIVELHGGKILADSHDEWIQFVVQLPRLPL